MRFLGHPLCPFVLKKFINIQLGTQGRSGQGRGRGHLEGGVCEERDEQQVHPQHAQRLNLIQPVFRIYWTFSLHRYVRFCGKRNIATVR